MLSFFIEGTAQEFKKRFETPILRGRDADATDEDHKKGQEKLQEVNTFIQIKIVVTQINCFHLFNFFI